MIRFIAFGKFRSCILYLTVFALITIILAQHTNVRLNPVLASQNCDQCQGFFDRLHKHNENYDKWQEADRRVPSKQKIEDAEIWLAGAKAQYRTDLATYKAVGQVPPGSKSLSEQRAAIRYAVDWINRATEARQQVDAWGEQLRAEEKLLKFCDQECNVRETLPSPPSGYNAPPTLPQPPSGYVARPTN